MLVGGRAWQAAQVTGSDLGDAKSVISSCTKGHWGRADSGTFHSWRRTPHLDAGSRWIWQADQVAGLAVWQLGVGQQQLHQGRPTGDDLLHAHGYFCTSCSRLPRVCSP